MILATISTAAALGAASGAHCITMCGPLVVAGCAHGRGGGRAAIGYFAGRFVSYGAVGALAGSIGGPLVAMAEASREVRIVVSGILALSIAVAALKWLRPSSSPKLVRLGRQKAPSSFFSKLARFVPMRGVGLGLATGFFPCGALAAGLLVAASSGTAHGGALSMFAFAAASAPALVGMVLFGDRAAKWIGAHAGRARPIIGVALLGLAGWLAITPWLSAAHAPASAACSCETRH